MTKWNNLLSEMAEHDKKAAVTMVDESSAQGNYKSVKTVSK